MNNGWFPNWLRLKSFTTHEQPYKDAGVPLNFTSFIELGKGHELSKAMWERVKEVFGGIFGLGGVEWYFHINVKIQGI